jgi:hypothetical protein
LLIFLLGSLTTPVRSKSLIIDRRTPTIFKQKAASLPIVKPQKKKRKTTIDPMSIFDFYDDDENANETIELRSSITNNNDQNDIKETKTEKEAIKATKTNRRSTLTIQNHVPSDARCKECSNQGTNENMTE